MLGLSVRPVRPKINSLNATCMGQTYKYLDDEGEGVYRFGMAPCLVGSGALEYEGTYADGSELDNGAVEVNRSTGEVKVSAYRALSGHYRIKITGRDSCGGEASIFFSVIINTPPKAKA